jgi:hypothetical protein
MSALRHFGGDQRVRAALGVAVASAALLALAAARAIRLDPLPAPGTDSPASVAMLQAGERTPTAAIEEAVAAAPFTPGRTPASSVEPAVVPPALGGQTIVLVGTVVGADGDSFVVVSAGAGPVKVLRVGGEFEGYRLRSIGQASAVFMNTHTGGRVELRVPRSRQ